MTAQFTITNNLPFTSATIQVNNATLVLDKVLIDTGSAATLFRTDDLYDLGVEFTPHDVIRRMMGVGGIEFVVEKQIDGLVVGELMVETFTIQLGALNYGIPLNGIIGTDFLLKTNAIVDFQRLNLRKG